jgi:hypothetical protein
MGMMLTKYEAREGNRLLICIEEIEKLDPAR